MGNATRSTMAKRGRRHSAWQCPDQLDKCEPPTPVRGILGLLGTFPSILRCTLSPTARITSSFVATFCVPYESSQSSQHSKSRQCRPIPLARVQRFQKSDPIQCYHTYIRRPYQIRPAQPSPNPAPDCALDNPHAKAGRLREPRHIRTNQWCECPPRPGLAVARSYRREPTPPEHRSQQVCRKRGELRILISFCQNCRTIYKL
ncbi:hypothetical protein N658DRAFT_80777 [Parathielavia hyrcaniae]|uniref:Uncharacterized protein n=1 Tax=Parathielavia hyrcaniae TaxID=113614 RepID=A0AAN6Q1P1_9PEZI|nr:hypothetical protein N658DRAFT_80777 [Parathielavia hyrcaniae]